MVKISFPSAIKYLYSYAGYKRMDLDLSNVKQNGTNYYEGIVIVNGNEYFVSLQGSPMKFVKYVKLIIDKEFMEIGKALQSLEKKSTQIKNFREFIMEVESHIKSDAYITTYNGVKVNRYYAKKSKAYTLYYVITNIGTMRADYSSFYNNFNSNEVYAIVLSSKTDDFDDEVNDFIREIRGYVVDIRDNKLYSNMIKARELAEAYNKDPKTGEPLEPVKGVKYVGGDEICLNENFIQVKC